MGKAISIGERVLLTLWVGGTWAIGYLAVPSLFHALDDRQLAGSLAGNMFTAVYIVGLTAAVGLLAGGLVRDGLRSLRTWRCWVLIGALALICIAFFVLQPMMQELKNAGVTPGSEAAAQFGRLHGVSSVLYLATSLLGLVLVMFGLRAEAKQAH